MDLIVNQLKGRVLATSQRIQKKYERKMERQRNGRKVTVDTTEAADCSVGSSSPTHMSHTHTRLNPPHQTNQAHCAVR